MIQRLKAFLTATSSGSSTDSQSGQKHPEEALRLATATLLIEAAMKDGTLETAELDVIKTLLADYFELSSEEVAELVETGEKAAADLTQLYGVTRIIKDHFDQDERIQMIEMLWEVAYTDGRLHHLETNLIRRIAGLIYVPDRESGEAHRRVREKRDSNHADAL
jgi:uncharacterized tellurite resistance protein B-like protein